MKPTPIESKSSGQESLNESSKDSKVSPAFPEGSALNSDSFSKQTLSPDKQGAELVNLTEKDEDKQLEIQINR
jgi:hypothetical protein